MTSYIIILENYGKLSCVFSWAELKGKIFQDLL